MIASTTETRIIPAPVLVELDYFSADIHHEAFPTLIDDVRGGVYEIEDPTPEDYDRATQLMRRYADLRVGFVDAAVLAIVERLREPKLATLDHRHFAAMRPRHVKALELLPA